MKKTITTLAAAALATTCLVASPARAGSGGAFAAGVVTGVVGGIILNEATRNRREHRTTRRYYAPRPQMTAAQRAENREVQERLNALGFDCGRPDGVFGRRTRSAIRDFQYSIGAPVTGNLSNADIASLYERSRTYAEATVFSTAVGAGAMGNDAPVSKKEANPFAETEATPNPFAPPSEEASADAAAEGGRVAPPAAAREEEPVVREVRATMPEETVEEAEAPSAADKPAAEAPFASIEERPSIFGIVAGSPLTSVEPLLKQNGFDNCTTAGATILCERETASLKDKVVVAAAPVGAIDTVHTVMRELAFKQPVTRKFLTDQLSANFGTLMEYPQYRVSSSAACEDRLGASTPAAFASLVDKSAASDLFDGDTKAFLADCPDYYSIDMPDGQKVSAVNFTFFEGSGIKAEFSRLEAEKVAAQKSNEAAVAKDIKF